MPSLLTKQTAWDLLLAATESPALVEVPATSYLMIDGQGDPATSPEFDAAWETLEPLATALWLLMDVTGTTRPMPLECLRWADETAGHEPGTWSLLAALPAAATLTHLEHAMEALHAVGQKLPAFQVLRFGRLNEGKSVQMLQQVADHTDDPATERLLSFVQQQGLCLAGTRHEIYLEDPRRAATGSVKAVLRYPVTAV